MSTQKKKSKEKSFQRTILEWLGIAAVLGILFITGLHTEVLSTMQRAVVWTGLFDADARKITTANGPVLSERTYHLTLSTPEGNHVRLEDFKGKVLFHQYLGLMVPALCGGDAHHRNAVQQCFRQREY